MTPDTWLMVLIAVFAVFAGMGVATAYAVTRYDDIRRDCIDRLEQANAEVIAVRKMRKDLAIREALYGDIPVERLLNDLEIEGGDG